MRCRVASRSLVSIASIAAFFAPIALAASIPLACSSDDVTAAASDAATEAIATDGGAIARESGTDGAGATPTVRVGDRNVYVGDVATLAIVVDPPEAALTFVWELASKPAASVLTSASPPFTTTTDPTKLLFPPDVAGDYVVKLTASGAFGTLETTAAVHAFAAPVFYARSAIGPNGGEVGVHVAAADGTSEHAVACAISFGANEADQYRSRTLFAAATTMDGWEASPGAASRFAFSGTSSLSQDDAGNFPTFLIAGTTASSCTSVPTTLRAIQGGAGALGQPRFSPDGSRIAFVDPAGSGFGISTVAFDGTAYRPLTATASPPPNGSDAATNIRPEWADATHVIFPSPDTGGWSLIEVADTATPSATPLMVCTSATTPHHVAFVPGGAFVASYSPAAGAPTDIFLLQPGLAKECNVVRNLTKLTGSASRAHDFALSPDGKRVAYLHYDATKHDGGPSDANEGDLAIVPVDGSSPPVLVDSKVQVGRIGPRWIANGTTLAFTRAGTAADGGDARLATSVSVVLPDGGGSHDLASGDGVSVIVGSVGPGGSCTASRPSTRGASALGIMAGVLVLTALRRRALRKV